MSRKHYIEVAAVIAAERAMADDLKVTHALENVMMSLADIFKRDNPRFDRARFYAACDSNRTA